MRPTIMAMRYFRFMLLYGKECASGLAFKVTGKIRESQRGSGSALVVRELPGQQLRRRKLSRLAKPGHEIDPDVGTVEIAGGVEQMSLE